MATLRELQLCQLDIALEIKRICEKNQIPYFLIGGTLLGTIRHSGFIPWDDDIDIGFLRKDYEKFLLACEKDLRAMFFLQTPETDDCYGYMFGKIQIKGTEYNEAHATTDSKNKGIFVDIFPFDNMPDGTLNKKVHYYSTFFFRKLLLMKCGYKFIYKSQMSRIRDKIIEIIAHGIKREFIIKCLEACAQKYKINYHKCVVNMGGNYRYNEFIEYSNLFPLKDAIFETYIFPIPNNYDALLKHMYGDYMQLPPVEKRGNVHNIINANMNTYIPANRVYKSEYGNRFIASQSINQSKIV